MKGFDAAIAAVHDADVGALRAIVEAEPDVMHVRDDEGHTLLDSAMWALLVGDWSRPPTIAPDTDGRRMSIVLCLLDAGSDVNGRGQDGWTPLHTALYEGHVELTAELLGRGADPSVEVYGSGGTPLLQALFWGHAAAADVLAETVIEPRNLRVAAGLGRMDLIAEHFDASGALRPSAFASRGYYRPHTGMPEWTPSDDAQQVLDEALTYAVRNARSDAVLELVARGASVDGAPYGGGPLHFAASSGGLEILRWLLKQGADPSLRADVGAQDGVTPLHVCAWLDRTGMARALVARGADTSIEDLTHHGTPLGWAEHLGSEATAAYLRSL